MIAPGHETCSRMKRIKESQNMVRAHIWLDITISHHSLSLALGRVTRLADLVLEAAGTPGSGHGAQDHLLLRVEVEADPEAGHVLRESDIVRGRAPPPL